MIVVLKKLSVSQRVCVKFKPVVLAAVQWKVLACIYWSEWELDWILSIQPKVVIGVLLATATSFCLADHAPDVAKYTPRLRMGTSVQNLFYCSHLVG